MKNRNMLLVSTIAIAIFSVFFYYNIIESSQTQQPAGPGPGMMQRPFDIPLTFQYRLLLSPLLLIIAIIPLSYYFISKKMENNMKAVMKLIGKSGYKADNGSSIINKEAVLKLLNFNERKVIERLIKKKGEVLQSEISGMDGMDKLKTHRAIRNLEQKGVIETESAGKTRRIILSKDIRDIMLK